ncbi:hypothetical protein, partial [Klebsiella pneumoniae]|uniref:hypothetical protein n=1 Tax=Klebsiella pneumoniae TaxID=573 RepID=UPI00273181EE
TYSIKQSPKEYEDRLHYHLKEVKIEGLTPGMLMMELVEYLLKNCVSLKQMVFVVGAEDSHIVTRSSKFRKWQNINPNAKLIVI